jgi:DNA modification methylase
MTVRILRGDCRQVLDSLPAASVNCCVTSPPYYGLRDYGVDGQIGLELSPAAYVDQLVEVFRGVYRVLREDGTLWLNLGDSYAGSWGAQGRSGGNVDGKHRYNKSVGAHQVANHPKRAQGTGTIRSAGVKPKDLYGIPWMVAFALRADGWFLRQDIIWSKPNPMPESVRDRCTKAHEYVFLLSKSDRYHFDSAAIAEPVAGDPEAGRNRWDTKTYDVPGQKPQKRTSRSGNSERKPRPGPEASTSHQKGSVPWEGSTRNKRSVWQIGTQPFSEAHFATMPPALAEQCVLAGCPKGGTVLDPFGGAGTTGLVADRLQRHAVLIELNPAYAEIACRRIHGDAPLFAEVSAA